MIFVFVCIAITVEEFAGKFWRGKGKNKLIRMVVAIVSVAIISIEALNAA